MTWDQMLQSRIFTPLEMHRTGTHQNFCGPENVSQDYGALGNSTPVRIGMPRLVIIQWPVLQVESGAASMIC
jgi:CubicO group peptidase (beta-lactamase class C family)